MIWILAVSVCGAALSASAEDMPNGTALSAQESQTALSDADANAEAELELYLPESYEQYLDLENPSDFAINKNYIAIADDLADGSSCIYILDRTSADPQYICYEHESDGILRSLNFYEANGKTYLFFLDSKGPLYYLDCAATDKAQLVEDLEPYSIIFNGSDVFYAQSNSAGTNVYYTQITVADDGGIALPPSSAPLNQEPYNSTGTPAFSVYAGVVYFAFGKQIYSCTQAGIRDEYPVDHIVYNFSIIDTNANDLIYVSIENILYFRDEEDTALNDLNYIGVELDSESGGKYAYIVTSEGRILRYDLNSAEFDNYEIARYSDSANRIGAAVDISAYDNKFVAADAANERILICDNGNYRSTQRISANSVCAGKENFLAITDAAVLLYNYTGEQIAEVGNLIGEDIGGAAYSFGYFILLSADGKNTYKIDAATGELVQNGALSSAVSPTDLAADLFGNIYVLSSGHVDMYTDDQFFSEQASPKRIASFDLGTQEIFVDYAGNVYALTEDALFIQDADHSVPLDFSSIVYNKTQKTALSFAFDIESGNLYILSDGFIVKADLGANAPASLSNIAADGLYESLHGAPSGESEARSMLVTVPAGSIILPISDAQEIGDSTDLFPYTSYMRTDEARTGVRVCELDAGTIVAFYLYAASTEAGVSPTREYTLALVLDDKYSTEDDIAGLTDRYTSVTQYTGYITNEVGLYRFPLMRAGNATIYSNDMPRLTVPTEVQVLGKISSTADEDNPGYGLDFDYYFVKTVVGGETVYGFIPTNYVIGYDASADWSDSEDFTFRHVKRGETITLSRTEGDSTFTLDLSDEEQVKVYGEPDWNNEVYVTYTDEYGIVWSGRVNADLLYEADPSALVVLAVVSVVVAAVLVSTCYLILRKQPMMQ